MHFFIPVHCSLTGLYYWTTVWLLVGSMTRNAPVFPIVIQAKGNGFQNGKASFEVKNRQSTIVGNLFRTLLHP